MEHGMQIKMKTVMPIVMETQINNVMQIEMKTEMKTCMETNIEI